MPKKEIIDLYERYFEIKWILRKGNDKLTPSRRKFFYDGLKIIELKIFEITGRI